MHMLLQWEISGSGPQGPGLTSQPVSAMLPARLLHGHYELVVEEIDGQDVNTHTYQKKKMGTNNNWEQQQHNRAQNPEQLFVSSNHMLPKNNYITLLIHVSRLLLIRMMAK